VKFALFRSALKLPGAGAAVAKEVANEDALDPY
jgi:hypothetical protein